MPVMLRVSRHASMIQVPLAETNADRGKKAIVLTPYEYTVALSKLLAA
jgi:hypothetical protein